MREFRFLDQHGSPISAAEWLPLWAGRFPAKKYAGHDDLIAKGGELTSEDFIRIGRWKDAAISDGKWKPNVASVAYDIWMQAAAERPGCPDDGGVAQFLSDWSNRQHTSTFTQRTVTKRFGLSRATTLLYFLSNGRYPIFDSRVRRAIGRLCASPVANTVDGYLKSYRPLFSEIAQKCGLDCQRELDKALFSYGDRSLRL